MNELLTPEIINLGSTAVVAIVAIWALVQVVKSKRNRNGNGEVLKMIKNMESNHLGTLDGKIEKIDDKADRIINILTEIRTILDKQK